MKRCTTCNADKNLSDFNKNKCRRDGLNNICRECSNKRSKQFYSDNRDHQCKASNKRKRERQKVAKDYVLSVFAGKECVDCGNDDVRVFEFDHVRGRKKHNIHALLAGGYSVETLKKEIAKCDIVCANCHRIRTFTRKPTYRNKVPRT